MAILTWLTRAWRSLPVLALAILVTIGPGLDRPSERPSLVLVGDSVTAGWGASDEHHAWPALLGVPVVVDAAPGAPSGAFLGRSWSAGTVVVELGINDFSQAVPPAVYAEQMRAILGAITADRVIVLVPYRIGRDGTPAWDAYADRLIAVAQPDPRVVIVDLRNAFGAPATSLLASDLVHPNDSGHALIARLVTQAMTAPVIARGIEERPTTASS